MKSVAAVAAERPELRARLRVARCSTGSRVSLLTRPMWQTENHTGDNGEAARRGDVKVGCLNAEGDNGRTDDGNDNSGDGRPHPSASGLLGACDLPCERHER